MRFAEEEHRRIVEREPIAERKLYEMLWETGGSQGDIARLHWSQIDLTHETIRFRRRKLEWKKSGGSCLDYADLN